MHKFQNCVIVLDDMGDRLNRDIAYYFTEGIYYNIQMIVMCHKPAQIINTARMSCDTFYLTIYNGPDLFKNFNEIYKCEHDFSKIISELNSNHYNRTDGMSDELRYGIIKYNKKENTFIIFNSNQGKCQGKPYQFFVCNRVITYRDKHNPLLEHFNNPDQYLTCRKCKVYKHISQYRFKQFYCRLCTYLHKYTKERFRKHLESLTPYSQISIVITYN